MDHFIDATLSDISRRGLIKKIHVLEGAAESTVIVDGKRCIQLASNNYLGLTTHPKIRAAAIEAFSLFGAGAGAVPPSEPGLTPSGLVGAGTSVMAVTNDGKSRALGIA